MSTKPSYQELEQKVIALEEQLQVVKRELHDYTNEDQISQKRYQALFQNMNTGFVLFKVVLDDNEQAIDLIIVAGNKEFENTTGLDLKKVIGKRLTEALPGIEKDPANWIETYAEIALHGESKNFESGSKLLGYFYNVSAYQPEPLHCAVTFLDVTERKETENQLKAIYESTMEHITFLDTKLKIRYINKEAEKHAEATLGQKIEIGDSISDFQHLANIDAIIPLLERSLKGERIEIERHDGENWWIMSVYPVRDESDEIIGVVNNVKNITSSKINEIHVQKQNETLRQIAIHQSHSIRGPVASILGLYNLLKNNREGNEEARMKYVDLMLYEVNLLDRAIHEIVRLSSQHEEYQTEEDETSY